MSWKEETRISNDIQCDAVDHYDNGSDEQLVGE